MFENDIHYCLRQVHPATLDMEDKSLVDCLHTPIIAKSNKVTVHGFEMEELDFHYYCYCLSIMLYVMIVCIICYITFIFNSVLYTMYMYMISINNNINKNTRVQNVV